MWESQGKLPKRLLPKRGKRNWRFWTIAQVHGPNGIIDWMRKNNMRPGNVFTSPDQEHGHVAKLRKPKYLKPEHMEMAIQWARRNWYIEQIAEELLPLTRYQSIQGLIRALIKAFKYEDLEPPKSAAKEHHRNTREQRLSQTPTAISNRRLRARRRAGTEKATP